MTDTILKEALRLHQLWSDGAVGGARADLSGVDLRRADLRWADLREADLSGANLSEANLSGADLREADLSGADLSGADLSGANLSEANLSEANLSEANLSGADLRWANLSEANLSGARGLPPIDRAALRAEVAAQIRDHPETHDQTTWHNSCGTRHCVAGWTVLKAGPLGAYLEQQLGSATAAHLLLGGKTRPSFAVEAQTDAILAALEMCN